MREATKIAGFVALFSIFSADLGTCAVESFGRLNQPAPGGRESQSAKQPSSANEHHGSQNAQSNSTPMISAIQSQQAEDHHSIASESQDEGEWYSRPDWWVAILTGLLVISTDGLWIFTALLWRSTSRAVNEGAAALALARDEFNATHRPKLRVRFFQLPDLADGSLIFVRFAIVNVGSTPAHIKSLDASMEIKAPERRDTGPISLASPFDSARKIAGGEQIVVQIGRDANIAYDISWFVGDGWSVALRGTIIYTDSTVERRTGFDRIYRHSQRERPDADNSLRRVETSEFEYED